MKSFAARKLNSEELKKNTITYGILAAHNQSRGMNNLEIYRYLVWPGQAASCYTGFLEFRSLLEREKERLGENFDYRVFHSSLVSGGPMPLYILKKEIFHYDLKDLSRPCSGSLSPGRMATEYIRP